MLILRGFCLPLLFTYDLVFLSHFFFFHNLIQTFLFIYLIICLFIWLFCFFVYLLAHSLIDSFIHLFICLFVYSYDQKFPFCQIRGFQAMSLLRNFILCSFILNTF